MPDGQGPIIGMPERQKAPRGAGPFEALEPGRDQAAPVAEARSTLTPGPMVEDSETFFR